MLNKVIALCAVAFLGNNALAVEKVDDKDKEALAWLMVLDKNEIAAANEANKKNVQGEVKEFADWMIKEHTHNLKETTDLSAKLKVQPLKTKEVISLEESGNKELKDLSKLNNNEFQKDYMKAMVKGHTDALKTLDADYLDKVGNTEIKEHLKTTRMHVEKHLEKAKSISDKL